MGIRDTHYYAWNNINLLESKPGNEISDPILWSVAVDSNGNIYCVGQEEKSGSINWVVERAKTSDLNSFERVDYVVSAVPYGVAIDSSNKVYVVGYESGDNNTWFVRRSTTGNSGSFETVDSDLDSFAAQAVAIDSSNKVYVVGTKSATRPRRKLDCSQIDHRQFWFV